MKNTEFGAIYARYRARSKRLARAILKNEDEAEDVCHDVFVKLYKMGEEFDTSSEKKMESWILTTTERTALDYYKKGYRKHEYADSDEIERAAEVLAQSRSTVDEVIEVIEAHDSVGAFQGNSDAGMRETTKSMSESSYAICRRKPWHDNFILHPIM